MAKTDQPWKRENLTKDAWLRREVAKAVGAGKQWECETVDFSDPNRPDTCLEVDFPIIPINQIAAIEGNAGKPIYQMSKWWARRRSSVFRSLLLAAAIKAPDDRADAAKLVWDAYYGNHQAKGAFKHLKVADIFMGGGTTIVEGSRLGMQMYGNDLNPVAWFVVKNEMAKVDKAEVEKLLADVEAEVKPQLMPFYACDCPRGHKGTWTKLDTNEVMGDGFDPLVLMPDERKQYRYSGPETIYVFWAKHGPCATTGCGHRTPIMSSPVMAIKTLTVNAWEKHACKSCGQTYDVEARDARMAPGVPLVVADGQAPFAVATLTAAGKPASAVCPHCRQTETFGQLPKPTKKKIELTLLVHRDWLRGEPAMDAEGRPHGGSADDSVEATVRWNQARAKYCKLVEVRGPLPAEIPDPYGGEPIKTGTEGGTGAGKSRFACQSATCGTGQDVRESISKSKKNGPVAMYAVQGYCPTCDMEGEEYRGRFFAAISDPSTFNAALSDWEARKNRDLSGFWPTSEIPHGFMTAMNNGDIRTGHGFTHWWKMFNPRQLLVQCLLLRTIVHADANDVTRDYVLGTFQNHLRNQCMFSFWHQTMDKLAPALSNSNFHPKSTMIEVGVYPPMGYGPWASTYSPLFNAIDWREQPWELVHNGRLGDVVPELSDFLTGLSEKAVCRDSNIVPADIWCGSSTEVGSIADSSLDLVITDPPFGGLLHYSELADFFHVWLRLGLKNRYPAEFNSELTPKAMEAVANAAREPGNENDGRPKADVHYQRLLTACWREAYRTLKHGGMLAFTFHHKEDEPWVAVLESLFDAGFFLQATYPIRSDETKGEGAKPGTFGSQTIEFDIIHVCRKRQAEPAAISWAKLRRQVLADVRDLKDLLEHHQKDGLPEADLQVIRRGKALEYFSRHYGKVFKNPETPMTVAEGLLGINQLLDEETDTKADAPPHNAEPFTRMLLRLFNGKSELPRNEFQKYLRGTGSGTGSFVERGWVREVKKVFHLVSPPEIAAYWKGRARTGMTGDYDQAMFLIGACYANSGINAGETLNNANFTPHPALGAILSWLKTRGATPEARDAASVAATLHRQWEQKNGPKVKELMLFELLGDDEPVPSRRGGR